MELEDTHSGDHPVAGETSHQTLRAVLVHVADRDLGFPLADVSEVLPMVALTPVPESPAWLSGMVNLRGTSLPVIDLRSRLELPARDPDPDPDSIIVVCKSTTRGDIGFIVDSISDIGTLETDPVATVDDLSGQDHPITSIARDDERLVVILDVDRLVERSPEIGSSEKAG